MKRLLFIILALILLAQVSFAIDNFTVNSRLFNYRDAELMSARSSWLMYSGEDTLVATTGTGATGYGTSMTTGIIQVGYVDGGEGAYPNDTATDTLVHLKAEEFYFWIHMDTTSRVQGDATFWSYTGDAPDTVGFENIIVRYYMIDTDDPAWRGDTLNIFVEDGRWNSDQYGTYHYEELILPVATAGAINRWWVYRIPVVPCAYIEVIINSADNILETPIIQWRVVAINVGS